MNKAKAKQLIAEIVEQGYNPTIINDNGDYTIRVDVGNPGVTLTPLQNLQTNFQVDVRVQAVSFN